MSQPPDEEPHGMLPENWRKWDARFLALAAHIAGWSKDPSTQVGAVLVSQTRVVLGMGYNGFPRGIQDTPERLLNREEKYKRIVHAEANALLNASPSSWGGATLYATQIPCPECTKLILQRPIWRVVAWRHPGSPERHKHWEESIEFLEEAKVRVDLYTKE